MEITTLNHQEFKKHLEETTITHHYYQTSAGTLQIAMTPMGIYQAHFTAQPKEAQAILLNDATKILLVGTEFQIHVWQELLRIPLNSTITYQELAIRIGHPYSWRAVANAVGRNNIAYFIPCHRIVRKNGTLGGYRWGVKRKAELLQHL
jgi:O-6-methylguanine DNA methyltransferase